MPHITKSRWSIEQTRVYKNRDRCHEEIKDFSPASDTVIGPQLLHTHASILTGDCNSGKSSLLYSFVNEESGVSFHKIQSLVPIVSGVFHNYRFCNVMAAGDDAIDICCDHGSDLLDSDISKVSLTLTQSDWTYLLDELACPPGAIDSPITSFTILELGGDHLERLYLHNLPITHEKAHTRESDPLTQDPRFQIPDSTSICDNTCALLQDEKLNTLSYFVNSQLILTAGQVNEAALAKLERNLKTLKKLSANLQQLDLYITRLIDLAPSPDRMRNAKSCEHFNDCSVNSAVLEESQENDLSELFDILESALCQDEVDRFRRTLQNLRNSWNFETLHSLLSAMDLGFRKVRIMPFRLMYDDDAQGSVSTIDICSVYYFLRNALKSTLYLSDKIVNSDADMVNDLVRYFEANRFYGDLQSEEIYVREFYDSENFDEFCQTYLAEADLRTEPSILSENFQRIIKDVVEIGICQIVNPKGHFILPERTELKLPDSLSDQKQIQLSYTPACASQVHLAGSRGFRFPRDQRLFTIAMSAIRRGCLSRPNNIDWKLVKNIFRDESLEISDQLDLESLETQSITESSHLPSLQEKPGGVTESGDLKREAALRSALSKLLDRKLVDDCQGRARTLIQKFSVPSEYLEVTPCVSPNSAGEKNSRSSAAISVPGWQFYQLILAGKEITCSECT